MRLYVYDVETLPNFFCATFMSYDNGEFKTFVIDEHRNDRKEIVKFVEGKILVGYNSATFDNIILNTLIKFDIVSAFGLHKLAQRIIGGQKDPNFSVFKEFRELINSPLYESIDLIRLLFSRKLRVGLKELECSLQHDNVEEFEKFDEDLSEEEKQKCILYNINDCRATRLVLEKSMEALKLRRWAEKEYGIKAYSMDGVSLGANILAKEYERVVGNNLFLQQKTQREYLHIKDLILPCVKFETPEFQAVLKRYQEHTWYSSHFDQELFEDSKLKFEPLINGHRFKFSLGGLHHETRPGIYKSDDEYTIYSIDAASYYPSMTLSWKWCPGHLDPDVFLPIYQKIKDERIAAKKNDPLKADTLKLSLNATFGNYGNFYSWLFDHKVRLQICVNGQLLLGMLCEQLFKAKIDLIDANTDGIFIKVRKDQEAALDSIIEWWQDTSKVILEKQRFESLYFVNTADYFGVDDKGKMKEKGMFLSKVALGKGMEFPIIATSVKKYFLEGIPIEQTIRGCDNILQFCTYKKLGRDAECWHGTKKVQRTNRYYASKGGAYLFRKSEGRTSHLLKESPVITINKLDDKPVGERSINYGFYTHSARDVVYAIEGDKNQAQLF